MHVFHSAFLVVVAVIAAGGVYAQDSVDRPQLSVGDRWTFKAIDVQKGTETQTYEQRVTELTGDKMQLDQTVLSSTDTREVGLVTKREADAATWTFVDAAIIGGKVITLAFPLAVGKTWEFEFRYKRPLGEFAAKRRAKVEGWEDVRVPAGTFRALKVVHEGFWNMTGGGPGQGNYNRGTSGETLWYAPEAMRIVKRESFSRQAVGGSISDHMREELVSFEVRK
jgi:hypothetical protein